METLKKVKRKTKNIIISLSAAFFVVAFLMPSSVKAYALKEKTDFSISAIQESNAEKNSSEENFFTLDEPVSFFIDLCRAVSAKAIAAEAIEITTDREHISDDQAVIQIQKYSSTPDIANIDGIRELANAEYTIYSDKALTNIVNTLTTDSSGWTKSLSLLPGTYYVHETISSKRYSQDETIYTVKVDACQRALIRSQSDPQLTTIAPDEWGGISLFAAGHTLTTTREYGTWNLSGSGAYGQQEVLKVDGKYAFCLEGWKSETSGNNTEVSWSTLGMNSYKEKLVLMAYYGYYSQPSAANYYLTQNLIWDEVMRVQKAMGWQVYAVNSTYSSLSSMQSFFSSVRSKVSSFDTKPSFNGKSYDATAGQEITITDTKNVLSDCYISDKGGTNAAISKNSLKITAPTKPGTYTVKLKRGNSSLYSGTPFAVRYNSDSQAISTLTGGITWDASVTIRISENKGKLQITKVSADTPITDDNTCYTLEGAIYTVYSDKACTASKGTLTTSADGSTTELALDAGTYYIKETTAPKGYALDNTVHEVKVESGQTTVFEASDQPQTATVNVLLEKIDADTLATDKTLANAEFTFKFYAAEYADNVNPAVLGKSPTRTWVLKTDEQGKILLDSTFRLSGDELYRKTDGNTVLPLGTLTIQETKSPDGYHLDNTVYIQKISAANADQSTVVYNAPVIKEKAVKLNIFKYETGSSQSIAGVSFIHVQPEGTKETLKTDSNGQITLHRLSSGKHQIYESDATADYEKNPNVFEFEIKDNGAINVITTALSDKGYAFNLDNNGNGELKAYNSAKPFSLIIHKMNNDKEVLSGAEFTLYSDAACQDVLEKNTSDKNGCLVFDSLLYEKTYYFKETQAPAGYRLDESVHTIQVTSVSPANGTFTFKADGTDYNKNDSSDAISFEAKPGNYQIHMNIVNQTMVQLPESGSDKMLILAVIIVILGGTAIVLTRKSKKNK